jgi:hypothetical protein
MCDRTTGLADRVERIAFFMVAIGTKYGFYNQYLSCRGESEVNCLSWTRCEL